MGSPTTRTNPRYSSDEDEDDEDDVDDKDDTRDAAPFPDTPSQSWVYVEIQRYACFNRAPPHIICKPTAVPPSPALVCSASVHSLMHPGVPREPPRTHVALLLSTSSINTPEY